MPNTPHSSFSSSKTDSSRTVSPLPTRRRARRTPASITSRAVQAHPESPFGHPPDPLKGNSPLPQKVFQFLGRVRRSAEKHPGLAFAEEEGDGRQIRPDIDLRPPGRRRCRTPPAPRPARPRTGHGPTKPSPFGSPQAPHPEGAFPFPGRSPADVPAIRPVITCCSSLPPNSARVSPRRKIRSPSSLKSWVVMCSTALDQPDHADHGGGKNRPALRSRCTG